MDNLIKKLEVIASLTEGMTLSTSQFPTLISHNSWSTTIWRTYSREDRQKTVLYIRDILDAAVTLLKALSEEQQVELKSHIVSALKGFETLKLTYKGDFTTLGLITSIIDNVTSLLNGDPLFFKYVVNKNYDEIEKYLYDGMDVNVLNSKGQNVMHLLCHKELFQH
jgi:hypothetical protein